MANPSLQIGNGKFAIKENDLLGYSSSGTKFFPIPITMTRATLGSRVNPSGLVEDVELLGSEEIVNGSFTGVANGTDVATLANWNDYNSPTSKNVVDNKLVIVAQGSNKGAYYDLGSLTAGTYKLSVDITGDVGAGGLFISATSSHNITTSVGTVEYYFAASGSTLIFFRAAANNVGTTSYTNISVKKATIDGLARVDYTDGTASLLVEPQRTNLITYSEDFSQSVWAKNSVGNASAPIITTNYATSPDGTQNASRLQLTVSGSTSSDKSFLENLFNLDGSSSYTLTFYIKSNNGSNQNLIFLQNSVSGNAITATNQWVRIQQTVTSNTTNSRGFGLMALGNIQQSVDVIIFGAQLELGSYATSYIKTTGITVTRNTDQYTKTGISDKINSEEGVFFIEMATFLDEGTTADKWIALSDGTANNSVRIAYSGGANTIRAYLNVGGSAQADMTYAVTDVTQFSKIAFSYAANNFNLWVDGVKRATDTSGNVFSVNTLNRLGLDNGGGGSFPGKIKQLQIYKTALSDSELATLTT